jgi:hypothetical protein
MELPREIDAIPRGAFPQELYYDQNGVLVHAAVSGVTGNAHRHREIAAEEAVRGGDIRIRHSFRVGPGGKGRGGETGEGKGHNGGANESILHGKAPVVLDE